MLGEAVSVALGELQLMAPLATRLAEITTELLTTVADVGNTSEQLLLARLATTV